MKIKISLHKIWRIPVFLFSWRSSQGMRCENSPEYGEVIRLKNINSNKEMWNVKSNHVTEDSHLPFHISSRPMCAVWCVSIRKVSSAAARDVTGTAVRLLAGWSLLQPCPLSESLPPVLPPVCLSPPIVSKVQGDVPQGNPYLNSNKVD